MPILIDTSKPAAIHTRELVSTGGMQHGQWTAWCTIASKHKELSKLMQHLLCNSVMLSLMLMLFVFGKADVRVHDGYA